MDKRRSETTAAPAVTPSRRRRWIGFGTFALVAVVFLWQEHQAHLLGALPWLILLACPLLHVFMHGGHGGHGHDGRGGPRDGQ